MIFYLYSQNLDADFPVTKIRKTIFKNILY